jgi:ribosomal protein S10
VIALPTRKRIYCVLRSPHVEKDAREHFEIRVHKRILEIYYDSEVPIFDLLSEADLPPGVFLPYMFIINKFLLFMIHRSNINNQYNILVLINF